MARLRTRFKRSLLLAIALAILALLLEMNTFLPGSWPGGDGGGIQQSSELGERAAPEAPEAEAEKPAEPLDPEAVEAPQEKPEAWPPKTGIRIQVRGPDGELAAGWRLGAGDGGREDGKPDAAGVLQSRDDRILTEGFRIRSKQGLLRHRRIPSKAAVWTVQLPGAPLPAQRQAGRIQLEIVDRATGAALPEAEVSWIAHSKDQRVRSDAEGRAELSGDRSISLLRATVTAKDRRPRSIWLSPRDPRPQRVELDETFHLETELVFPSEVEGLGVYARLLDAKGQTLPAGRVKRISNSRFDLTLPQSLRATAWIEFMIRDQVHGASAFRRPVSELGPRTEAPAFEVVRVTVRDVNGKPTLDAHVSQACQTCTQRGEESEPQRFLGESLTKGDGAYETIVPAGRPFTLLVESPGHAPMARRFVAGDGNVPLDFVAEAGLKVPVRVLDASGAPLEGASVLARASLLGMRILRAATTDADGRAALGPFAAGPVEVFARSPDFAWAAVVADAAAGMGTLTLPLERGYPLTLVVEDAFGLPLEGVDVELTPGGGGRPLVSPPSAQQRTTSPDGTLVLPDLPNRLYDLSLSLPGYHLEKVRKVRPGAVTYYATLVRK